MIKINDEVIDINHYPDGTLLLNYLYQGSYRYVMDWLYDSDEELVALIYLMKHIPEYSEKILNMPYIPNARMDRVENVFNVFTLKYFSDVINSLGFDEVHVLDPHSTVSEALINNICVESPETYIYFVMGNIGKEDLTIFYPDAGSLKRYSGMVQRPYVFGNKVRDWDTGVIKGLDVIGDVGLVKGHDILIVDDICSRGGTFYHSAKKLKELGANDIYLYITHCEDTILEGELINSGLVKRIYTTDTIFTKQHELIEIVANFRGGNEND